MKKWFIALIILLISVFAFWKISRSRTYQFMGDLVTDVQITDSLVALTFDDGPSPRYTDTILTVLDQYNVQATFFVTGKECEQFPAQAKKIVSAGHQLANHSYSHQRMIFKSMAFIESEIESTNQVIRKAGYKGEIFFRPPYCYKLFVLPWVLHQKNMVSITCDIEPESIPEVGNSAVNISRYIIDNVHPGSIILLHVMYDSREESRKSLPFFIRNLQEKGYRFVTVEELLRHARKNG